MSLAAISLILGHIAIFGVSRQPDEGTAAHLWQLLMVGQLPIVAFFAVTSFSANAATGPVGTRVTGCRSAYSDRPRLHSQLV